MRGTKEFYELIEQFEKNVKRGDSHLYCSDLSRCGENEPAYCFYNNGNTNQLFHSFMLGYQLGKNV